MEEIESLNCNCIKNATITVEREALNIKYGLNGTGKSTISKAIYYKSTGNDTGLSDLVPYGANETEVPTVNNLNFSNIKVFNEQYVNSYLFEPESFLEKNSFNVFLKSDECEELKNQIENFYQNYKEYFKIIKT